MNINQLPILLLLGITIGLVILAIEIGYQFGLWARKRRKEETESSVASITDYVIGLLAFILAFTFGIVTERYETRKSLVREEANLIRTAFHRADFLPDSEQVTTKLLLIEYTRLKIDAVHSKDMDKIHQAMTRGEQILDTIWDNAVTHAYRDMNSDVAAMYIESINDVENIGASRVVVGLHTRLPQGLWEFMLSLILLGMVAIGYKTAISGSRRSWMSLILAVSFGLVIILIEVLDRSHNHLMPVSQYPLEHLLKYLESHVDHGLIR
jgi:hypothetical protein